MNQHCLDCVNMRIKEGYAFCRMGHITTHNGDVKKFKVTFTRAPDSVNPFKKYKSWVHNRCPDFDLDELEAVF